MHKSVCTADNYMNALKTKEIRKRITICVTWLNNSYELLQKFYKILICFGKICRESDLNFSQVCVVCSYYNYHILLK